MTLSVIRLCGLLGKTATYARTGFFSSPVNVLEHVG